MRSRSCSSVTLNALATHQHMQRLSKEHFLATLQLPTLCCTTKNSIKYNEACRVPAKPVLFKCAFKCVGYSPAHAKAVKGAFPGYIATANTLLHHQEFYQIPVQRGMSGTGVAGPAKGNGRLIVELITGHVLTRRRRRQPSRQ
jgi:hypothetical protein